MSISEDDHEKLDVGSKEIIEENTSKDSIGGTEGTGDPGAFHLGETEPYQTRSSTLR